MCVKKKSWRPLWWSFEQALIRCPLLRSESGGNNKNGIACLCAIWYDENDDDEDDEKNYENDGSAENLIIFKGV